MAPPIFVSYFCLLVGYTSWFVYVVEHADIKFDIRMLGGNSNSQLTIRRNYNEIYLILL